MKNVMRAIRKMEPAWVKTCGLKFQLTSRTIIQPNGGTRKVPCYQLTKTECLPLNGFCNWLTTGNPC